MLVHNGDALDCHKWAAKLFDKHGGRIISIKPKRSAYVGKIPNDPRSKLTNHRFQVSNGIIRDGANPNGMIAKEWFEKFKRENGIIF